MAVSRLQHPAGSTGSGTDDRTASTSAGAIVIAGGASGWCVNRSMFCPERATRVGAAQRVIHPLFMRTADDAVRFRRCPPPLLTDKARDLRGNQAGYAERHPPASSTNGLADAGASWNGPASTVTTSLLARGVAGP